MKTTEIFVEQVLIGLLVLVIGYLPYQQINEIAKIKLEGKTLADGAVIVAIAYLLGIVLDRFADTLLSRLEQYHRLTFAVNLIKRGKQASGSDPYPEDSFLVRIMKKGSKELNEREHYLRTRIRLSRALAVFTPALTISALFSSMQPAAQSATKDNITQDNITQNIIFQIYWAVTGLIYLSCFVYICLNRKIPKIDKTYDIDISRSAFYFDKFVPLDEIKKLCSAIWECIKHTSNSYNDPNKIKERRDLIKWLKKLLENPNLYDILPKKAYSKSITKLVDKTKENRNKDFSNLKEDEQRDIIRLNRLLLENTCPQKIPKSYSWLSLRSWCWREPTIIAAGLLFIMMIILAGYYNKELTYQVLGTGLGICTISALSWWRINETFMKFLMNCDKD